MKEKRKVLVVEDDPANQYMMKEMLERMFCDIEIASCGAEAIQMYKQNREDIDLVILDVVMPKKNGPETFRELKIINPEVKVLLSSGYSLDQTTQKLLSEGVAGFLQKPYTIEQLQDKIVEIVSDN